MLAFIKKNLECDSRLTSCTDYENENGVEEGKDNATLIATMAR